MSITNNEKLELHYYFFDEESHTMNAIVRNRCEHEILLMVGTISKELGIEIKIESEPKKDGGLIDIYNFICSAEGAGIMSLTALVITILEKTLPKKPNKKTILDIEEQKLRIENEKLELQLKKQKILKNEVKLLKGKNHEEISEAKNDNYTKKNNDEVISILNEIYAELDINQITLLKLNPQNIESLISENFQISKFKSNFYRQLSRYPKVEKISATKVDSTYKPIGNATIVERNDFSQYIIENEDLEPIINDHAVIEIISPVLQPGKYKWKGVLFNTGNTIEFTMSDRKFKKQILKEGLTFQSGSYLHCTIKIDRKSDEVGNIYNSNYNVTDVIEVKNRDGVITETIKGKNRRLKKEVDEQQLRFFKDTDLN